MSSFLQALLLEAASLLEDGGKARGASTSASRICRVKAFRYAFVKQSGGTASDAPFAKSHRLSALANFLISVQVRRKVVHIFSVAHPIVANH